jgi:hypothetical protein
MTVYKMDHTKAGRCRLLINRREEGRSLLQTPTIYKELSMKTLSQNKAQRLESV